ncbi:MAG: hypothetical protein EXR07_09450 [Acetobacteraceae bacterium]|nr:hypothetical protein [Acetobacteraceae bacterium]
MHDTATKDDLSALKTELKADMAALKIEMAALEQRLLAVIENRTLRLTVRMGVMLAASLSLMTAIIGALIRFH